MANSKKYKLNKYDFRKIGKGFLIGVLGYALEFLAQILTQVDFGQYEPVAIIVGAVIINSGWKALKGPK